MTREEVVKRCKKPYGPPVIIMETLDVQVYVLLTTIIWSPTHAGTRDIRWGTGWQVQQEVT